MKTTRVDWDIFCRVIDNFGDIGVCWRLARNLAHIHKQRVRLWIDNLTCFSAIYPSINCSLSEQVKQGIEIRHWSTPFPEVVAADKVIELFGCALPHSYLQAMIQRSPAPIWINIEYLSAESWIEGCHGLASPHPNLPLTKYFFFPGFTAQSGGILYEPHRVEQRIVFQNSAQQQADFWEDLSLPPPQRLEQRISLFCYPNSQLATLLRCLAKAKTPYTCLFPITATQTETEKTVAEFFHCSQLQYHTTYQKDSLRLYTLPFLEQQRYEQLLWACDINFVRGEDSFVQAQLAARPFIWHIYPQPELAHRIKLRAFLADYAPNNCSIQDLWRAWNGYSIDYERAWQNFRHSALMQRRHAINWANKIARQQDLTAKLILFCENQVK